MVTQRRFCTIKGTFIKHIFSGTVTSRKIILLGKKVKADEDSFIKIFRVSHKSDKIMQLTLIGIPGTANDSINDLKSKQN